MVQVAQLPGLDPLAAPFGTLSTAAPVILLRNYDGASQKRVRDCPKPISIYKSWIQGYSTPQSKKSTLNAPSSHLVFYFLSQSSLAWKSPGLGQVVLGWRYSF